MNAEVLLPGIGFTENELKSVLGKTVSSDDPTHLNYQYGLVMLFALNPTLYFTADTIKEIDLFASLNTNDIRSKLRPLVDTGIILRCQPGIFKFNPKWLQYQRLL